MAGKSVDILAEPSAYIGLVRFEVSISKAWIMGVLLAADHER